LLKKLNFAAIFLGVIETDYNKDIVLSDKEKLDCFNELLEQKLQNPDMENPHYFFSDDARVNPFLLRLNNRKSDYESKRRFNILLRYYTQGAVIGNIKNEPFIEIYIRALISQKI